MAYQKIVESIPVEKREKLSDKLMNFVLKSKKESRMPSSLATSILDQWRLGPLTTETGLAVLLEAAIILESEKTVAFLTQELQLVDAAKAIEEMK